MPTATRPHLEAPAQARVSPLSFEQVYATHALCVARWAARLGGPYADYEDITQEVFLKVRRELPHFRFQGKLTTWLYRMTFNEVRHHRRKERLRRWLGGSAGDVAGHLPSERPSAPEDLEQRQQQEQLYRALDRLGEKYRTVLILFEMEGRGGDEVAELMGARVETVWVWLHRARARLARELDALEVRP